MATAKLIEVPDDAALPAVRLLVHEHTKQGEAGAVTLIFTGKRLKDLFELEGLTTRAHYGIRGFLGTNLDTKLEVIRLLAARPTEVFLKLHYPWGVLPVYLRQGESSELGSLAIVFDPPSRGWFLQNILPGLLPILGLEEAVTGPVLEGGNLVVTSYESATTEGIQLQYPAEQTGRVDKFLRELITQLDSPTKVHVILTTDLRTVQDLHESKTVIPCASCCSWHFGYVDLLTKESDVDPARLDEVAGFLAKRLGREHVLTFRDFSWSWQEESDPSTTNAVVWSVPKQGPGRIEMRWYDAEPAPRGKAATLRKELERFLAGPR